MLLQPFLRLPVQDLAVGESQNPVTVQLRQPVLFVLVFNLLLALVAAGPSSAIRLVPYAILLVVEIEGVLAILKEAILKHRLDAEFLQVSLERQLRRRDVLDFDLHRSPNGS